MRGGVFLGMAAALSAALGGCAATTPTSKVAVDYNRIFAKARNEVLVTNILRAAEREPLQFSTMGSVNGSVRNSGSLAFTIPSLNGVTGLSPQVSVNEGINPAVSIVPLSDKEFTEGILRPVTLDEINYFINQGWDKEMILELVVGGIVCPDGEVVFNRGDDPRRTDSQYDAFAQMFAAADRFPIQSVGKSRTGVIRMSASEALGVMKDGVGGGRSVVSMDPVSDKGTPTGQVDVTILTPAPAEFTGLRTGLVCRGGAGKVHAAIPTEGLVPVAASEGQQPAKVILRSPEAIIYFLGNTQWWRWAHGACGPSAMQSDWPYYWRRQSVGGVEQMQLRTLLGIGKACGKLPVAFRTFVQTHFNDSDYYLLRQEDAADGDLSLSTLSLVDELIALQTSEASITAGAPIIAIGAK